MSQYGGNGGSLGPRKAMTVIGSHSKGKSMMKTGYRAPQSTASASASASGPAPSSVPATSASNPLSQAQSSSSAVGGLDVASVQGSSMQPKLLLPNCITFDMLVLPSTFCRLVISSSALTANHLFPSSTPLTSLYNTISTFGTGAGTRPDTSPCDGQANVPQSECSHGMSSHPRPPSPQHRANLHTMGGGSKNPNVNQSQAQPYQSNINGSPRLNSTLNPTRIGPPNPSSPYQGPGRAIMGMNGPGPDMMAMFNNQHNPQKDKPGPELDMSGFPALGDARPSQSQSIPSAYSMAPGKKKQNMEFNIIQNDFPALPGAKAAAPGQVQQQAKPDSSSPDTYDHGQDPKYSPQQQSYQQQYPGLGQSAGAPTTPGKQQQNQQYSTGSPRMMGGRQTSPRMEGHGSPHQRQHHPQHQQQLHSQQHISRQFQQSSGQQQQQQQQQQRPQSDCGTSDNTYGLIGLLGLIQSSSPKYNPDLHALALGSDLTTLGLNLNSPEPLYPGFSSPWSESGNQRSKQPDFQLPDCYHVKQTALMPPRQRMKNMSDDALFYAFYTSPGDVAQTAAANVLFSRDWRYHKKHEVWITRAMGVEPVTQNAQFERGPYIYFDPRTWKKTVKEFTLYYEELEKIPSQDGGPR
eukprot:UC4_evm7s991